MYVIREYKEFRILPEVLGSGSTRQQVKNALARLGVECPKQLPRFGRAHYIVQPLPKPTYVISVV